MWNGFAFTFKSRTFRDQFIVDFESTINETLAFEIVDIMGKVVYKETLQALQGTNRISRQVNLPSGQYFARMYGDSLHAIKKFIVN